MVDAGKILITPKGNWSNLVSYEKLDLVTHSGKSWLSKVNDNVAEPSATAIEWMEYSIGGGGISEDAILSNGNTQEEVKKTVLDGVEGNPNIEGTLANKLVSMPTSINYDQEAELLSMYAGDTLISSTTIVASGGGGGVELAEPTDVVIAGGDEEATIKWTDPGDSVVSGVTLARWGGTVIVRKIGSAPTSRIDGTVVVDSKTRDAYKTTGFKDTGLVNGTKYYYGVFPYSTGGTYTYTKNVNVTPTAIYPEAATITEANGDNEKAVLTYTLPSGIASAELYWHTTNDVSDTVYTGTKGITGTTVDVTGLTNDTEYFFAIYTVNAKGRKTKSEVVSATPAELKIVTFADGTWEEISDMLDAHYAGKIDIADYWSIGDIKANVQLDAMSAMSPLTDTHQAQNVDFVIIGIKHDDLTNPINGVTKSAITIHMKNCLNTTGKMNSSNSGYTNSIYSTSARKNWINTIFEKALPDELQNLIKEVNKIQSKGKSNAYSELEQTTEKCFLLSNWEVHANPFFGYITQSDGNQYEYYKTASNRIKKANNVNKAWWCRSGFYVFESGISCFSDCNTNGGQDLGDYSANLNYGISVAMCL